VDEIQMTVARLTLEEGKKKYPYNDKTGKRVTCQPGGNISIGIGINLETGLDEAEIAWLLAHRLQVVQKALLTFYWYLPLDVVRRSVFLDLGYNMGIANLLHFPHMLAAVAIKNWPEARAQLLDSDAARQLPGRYDNLGNLLFKGDTT